MNKPFSVFIMRWLSNSLGLWVAVSLLGEISGAVEVGTGVGSYLLAGLIFSVVNTVIKPVAVVLSLPAIMLTLGLFMLVVNGFVVYLALLLAPGISMPFLNSILAGIIMSIINYAISATVLSHRGFKV